MSATVTYKGSTLTTVNNETKVLNTAGTWVEGDISITDVSSGAEDVTEKDVTFIDYDGRVVYSYTTAEFLALETMPLNPSHDGLTSQGWNWSLSDAQEYVEECGGLCIGQMYIPTDGKTHINIFIPNSPLKTMQLYFGTTVIDGVVVDWGDGTIESISQENVQSHTHEYSANGRYEITLDVIDGQIVWSNNSYGTLTGLTNTNESLYYSSRMYVESIYLGSGFTSLGTQPNIKWEQQLKKLTIPHGVVSGPQEAAACLPKLDALILPDTLTTVGAYAFTQNYGVRKISNPKSLVNLSPNTFRQNYSLQRIYISNDCKKIPNQMLYRANALSKFIVPKSVTSIGSEAFYQCYSLKELYLLPTTPPSLANTNAFTSIPSDCVFYVPYSEDHSILDAYKAATNWSSFESRMQEEPQ